jgi:signal transduction histidine kinase
MRKAHCAVAEILVQSTQSMQAMADQAQVHLTCEPLSAILWVDPDRLLQTLTNLLSNAIKFSEPGQTVWLKAIAQPQQVQFQVIDQGRGIPADQLQHIFEPFQQVDASDSRSKGGTGLGLAICRNIIEQHQGRIWAESMLGQGSTFNVLLPIDEPQGDRVTMSDV